MADSEILGMSRRSKDMIFQHWHVNQIQVTGVGWQNCWNACRHCLSQSTHYDDNKFIPALPLDWLHLLHDSGRSQHRLHVPILKAIPAWTKTIHSYLLIAYFLWGLWSQIMEILLRDSIVKKPFIYLQNTIRINLWQAFSIASLKSHKEIVNKLKLTCSMPSIVFGQ